MHGARTRLSQPEVDTESALDAMDAAGRRLLPELQERGGLGAGDDACEVIISRNVGRQVRLHLGHPTHTQSPRPPHQCDGDDKAELHPSRHKVS